MSTSSASIAQKLLSGQVICKWAFPIEFEHLNHESVFVEFERNFNFLDMRLAKTPNNSGYYLIYSTDAPGVKGKAREFFRHVMKDLRFTLDWLELMMEAMHRDQIIHSGEEMRFSDLLSTVIENMSLQDGLGRMPSSRGISGVRSQLENLVKRLKKEDILMDIHAGHEVYRFTGMVDLINEYILFIQESESIPIEEGDEAVQDRLL